MSPDDASGGLLPGVFSRYGKVLARAVGRLVRPHDVEDVVQETYMRVFQAAKRRPIRSPQSFMLKTARNIALDKLAWADALNHVITPTGEDGSDAEGDPFETLREERTPEVVLDSEQEFIVFCRGIRELPRQCRRAFLLRKVYGLSQREVAARMGVTEGAIEKHIARAMLACDRYMQAHGYQQRRNSGVASRRSRRVP